ncbi:MAG: methyltransferase [Lachnospiraceae bacterium]|nr:methyltransferase [Lachnospiraceae bacterium]MDE7205062.1 methyltransferase [Lachnospiraceae bacterium]
MIETEIKNTPLVFETEPTVFSPNAVDIGTLSMLSLIDFSENDKVLDLGCGYGVVGILAGKKIGGQNVVMCDISEIAVSLAKRNAELNGISNIDTRISNGLDNIIENDFTLILSNPPYHTDFSVAKHFIEIGFKKLKIGGRMAMVTKRLEWYKNKLSSVFGGVKVQELNGYYVFIAEKRCAYIKKKEKGNKLSKKLQRKKRK